MSHSVEQSANVADRQQQGQEPNLPGAAPAHGERVLQSAEDTALMLDEVAQGFDEFEQQMDDSVSLLGVVPDTQAGERLDKVLAGLFPNYSRTQLSIWCDLRRVKQNGLVANRRSKALAGASIELKPLPNPTESAFAAEDIALAVVYADESLAVINKQANLVIHPAAGNWSGTLLNALLYRFPQTAGLPRAGIVHRLDKDTTGLMVCALQANPQLELVRLLHDRLIKREYVAFAWGELREKTTVDTYIARDPRDRLRMAVCDETRAGAKRAITHFQPLQTLLFERQPITAVHCQLETGRTHQIRVHLKHLGLAMVQDSIYGRFEPKLESLQRQALHAQRLSFTHPIHNNQLSFATDLPSDMDTFWRHVGGSLHLASTSS